VPIPTFPFARTVKRDVVAPPTDVVEATSKSTVESPEVPKIDSLAEGDVVPIPINPLLLILNLFVPVVISENGLAVLVPINAPGTPELTLRPPSPSTLKYAVTVPPLADISNPALLVPETFGFLINIAGYPENVPAVELLFISKRPPGTLVPTPTFPLASTVKREDVAPLEDVVEAMLSSGTVDPNESRMESFPNGVEVPIPKLPFPVNVANGPVPLLIRESTVPVAPV